MYAYHILSSGYFPVEMTMSQWSSRRLDGSHSYWNPSGTARLPDVSYDFMALLLHRGQILLADPRGTDVVCAAETYVRRSEHRTDSILWFLSTTYIYIYTAHTYINIYIWGVVNMFSFSMLFFWKKRKQVWSGPACRSLRFWRGSHHVWKLEDFGATCTIWHLAWSPFLFQVQEATGTRFRTTTKLWLSKKWATNHISHVL